MTKIVIFIVTLSFGLYANVIAGGINAMQTDLKLGKYFGTPISLKNARLVCYGEIKELGNFLSQHSLNVLDENNAMPMLLLSSKCDRQDMFDILLSYGAELDIFLPNGMHLIHYFSEHKNKYYLQKAIDSGVSVNIINERKKWKPTPLFYAIGAGNITNMQLLISEGAEVNYQNSVGDTPIMYASNMNYYEAVYILIEAGADPQVKNNFGKSLSDNIKELGVDSDSESAVWQKMVVKKIQKKDRQTNTID